MPKTLTRKLAFCAMCVALGVVLRLFSIMLPVGGVGSLRIGLSPVIATLPALLFGPVWGGATAALVDVLGHIAKPEGAYLPWLTITALLAGLLRGLFWRGFKRIPAKPLETASLVFFSAFLGFGLFNLLLTALAPQTGWALYLQGLKNSQGSQLGFATWIPAVAGLVGLLLLALATFLKKHSKNTGFATLYWPIFLTVLLAGVMITTINTFILIEVFSIKKAFFLFYVPRLAEEIALSVLSAYFLSLLYPMVEKLGIFPKKIENKE